MQSRRPLDAPKVRVTALGVALAAMTVLSCRLDPVPQEIIDDLEPDNGSPSATHRPGEPCVLCHGTYGGVSPQMAFGGTVFTFDQDGDIIPAPGVEVLVLGAGGDQRKTCSNQAGNFFLPKEDWKEIAFPLKVRAGSRTMTSLIGRDGSCGACHKIPDPDHPERDPLTGAAHDSAGIVLVDPTDIDQCP